MTDSPRDVRAKARKQGPDGALGFLSLPPTAFPFSHSNAESPGVASRRRPSGSPVVSAAAAAVAPPPRRHSDVRVVPSRAVHLFILTSLRAVDLNSPYRKYALRRAK